MYDREMEFLHNHLPIVSRHREKIAAALLVSAAEDNGELTAIRGQRRRQVRMDLAAQTLPVVVVIIIITH